MHARAGTVAGAGALLMAAMSITVPSPARAQKGADTAWNAPAEFARRHNPVAPTRDMIERGRELYVFTCAQCHGAAGHGDGPQSGSFKKPPADLASPVVQSKADGTLFWQIATGRGDMPKTTLAEGNVWLVVAYVRTLGARTRR